MKQPVRAWAAVHATRPALLVMVVVAVTSVFLAQVTLSGFGVFQFVSPVPALLLLPAIAGVGAAMASDNEARLPLPDPLRAVMARVVWAVGWTMVAALASNAGQLAGSSADAMAVTRNVVLSNGLGLLTVSLGYPHLAWLPVLAFTSGCMVFGSSGGGYYWWAFIMHDRVTSGQYVPIGLLYLVSIIGYAWRPRWHANRR